MNSLITFFYRSLPVILVLGGVGCSEDVSLPGPRTLTGERIPLGEGAAWTELTVDPAGAPVSLAVVFNEAALSGLPRGLHPPAHETVLPLPTGVEVEPYDHATLDWNAHGHAPPGVYDLPHFDVHFYFIDGAERNLIAPDDTAGFNRPLSADLLPPMYIETPGGVPRMGAHVIDGMSPEIAGTGAFTHTFIYGKYDGRLVFLEPMVSEDFLLGKEEATAEIRRPATYGRSGYFPGTYRVGFDADSGTYRVALHDFLPY